MRRTPISLRLSAAFGKTDQSLQRLDLKRLLLGDTDVTGTVARRPEGEPRAGLRGDVKMLTPRPQVDVAIVSSPWFCITDLGQLRAFSRGC